MAEDSNIVEDIERVELPGSQGGENVEGSTGDQPDAPEGSDGEREPQEQLVVHKKPEEPTEEDKEDVEGGIGDDKTPKPVEGETPRERALRQQLEETRKENRRLMGGELKIGDGAPAAVRKELAPEKAAVLSRYDEKEIGALREVLPVLAEEMGYVRGDELQAQTYSERSQAELDTFLNEHKEYLPENDKDGILWNQFKEQFQMYRQPQNPKDYRKIFNRIHTEVFGIKPVGDKGPIAAAQRKIQVASHAGASGPTRSVISSRPRAGSSGLRIDMLKGFSEEEKAEMTGEGED